MLAAVPAASKGTLTDKDARWIVRGVQAGYASPVSDGERIYVLDNGGVLFAFDVKDGKQLWQQTLGTIAKASPVLADGKLYVGTENTGTRRQVLHHQAARRQGARSSTRTGSARRRSPELIIASPIVARGRVYVDVDGRAVRDRAEGHARQPASRRRRPRPSRGRRPPAPRRRCS